MVDGASTRFGWLIKKRKNPSGQVIHYMIPAYEAELENAINGVIKRINFMNSNALNTQLFCMFCEGTERLFHYVTWGMVDLSQQCSQLNVESPKWIWDVFRRQKTPSCWEILQYHLVGLPSILCCCSIASQTRHQVCLQGATSSSQIHVV